MKIDNNAQKWNEHHKQTNSSDLRIALNVFSLRRIDSCSTLFDIKNGVKMGHISATATFWQGTKKQGKTQLIVYA